MKMTKQVYFNVHKVGGEIETRG